MSAVNIRQALESALFALSPSLPTSFENAPFEKPNVTDPYQDCAILLARPDNLVFGAEHQEIGYMQVDLHYPLQAGTAAVMTRAELIRSNFSRGSSFTNGGIAVIIHKTPEILPGAVDGERFTVPVKVRFFANIN